MRIGKGLKGFRGISGKSFFKKNTQDFMENLPKEGKKALNVFLDSSVIIAAILSSTGGSFRLILESKLKKYFLLISPYILEECFRVLRLKYPEKPFLLSVMINSFPFRIVRDVSQREVERYIKIINPEDAPILACAIKHKVDYFITLDKKDFLQPEVLKIAKKHNLSILAPKDFFVRFH